EVSKAASLMTSLIKPQLKVKMDDVPMASETPVVKSEMPVKGIAYANIPVKAELKKDFVLIDCKPMDAGSFDNVKKALDAIGDDTYKKLTTVEDVIAGNCFSAQQVSELVNLLPTDDAKMEFAKKAYFKTVDKRNYDVVAGSFEKKDGKEL